MLTSQSGYWGATAAVVGATGEAGGAIDGTGVVASAASLFERWRFRLLALTIIVLLVILSGLLEHMAVKAFDSIDLSARPDWSIIRSIFALSLLFAGLTLWLWTLREHFLEVSGRVEAVDEAPAHAVLILFLSPHAYRKEHVVRQAIAELEAAIDRRSSHKADWLAALDPIIKPYPFGDPSVYVRWNWQQPLRIIASELRRSTPDRSLREIVVIVSTEKDAAGEETGSVRDYGDFKNLLEALLTGWPEGPPIIVRPGRHFIREGEYEKTYRLVRDEIAAARKRYKKRKVCVDVTGGITEFSIAGAIATLNQDMAFSYVSHAGKPSLYNTRITGMEFGAD